MTVAFLWRFLAVAAVMMAVAVGIVVWRRGRGVRKGKRGEHMVASELRRLRGSRYVVLNDVLLPAGKGRTSQIDHIVVSTRGIFVIETKSLSGSLTGSEHEQYWTQRLSSTSRQMYNPLLQNAGHIRTLHHLLPELDEDKFISMIVFTEDIRLNITADDVVEKSSWRHRDKKVRLDKNTVITMLGEMVKEIRKRGHIIERARLKEISSTINKAAIRDKAAVKSHKLYARETARNMSREIKEGICPRCGGSLVIRKGADGKFIGCKNYPTCRFTCSIDNAG